MAEQDVEERDDVRKLLLPADSNDSRLSNGEVAVDGVVAPVAPLNWPQIGFVGMLCFVNYCNFVCYSLIAPFFPKEVCGNVCTYVTPERYYRLLLLRPHRR